MRSPSSPDSPPAPHPLVYLVGAGPGDPELLTLRALTCLGRADLVLYDRLVPLRLLEFARPESERVCVTEFADRHRRARPVRAARDDRRGPKGTLRRPAQRRRPLSIRARRRRGGGASKCRHSLRDHPRGDCRHRRFGMCGDSPHAPVAGQRRCFCRRSRGPREARECCRLVGARPAPRHARRLYEHGSAGANRCGADRARQVAEHARRGSPAGDDRKPANHRRPSQ